MWTTRISGKKLILEVICHHFSLCRYVILYNQKEKKIIFFHFFFLFSYFILCVQLPITHKQDYMCRGVTGRKNTYKQWRPPVKTLTSFFFLFLRHYRRLRTVPCPRTQYNTVVLLFPYYPSDNDRPHHVFFVFKRNEDTSWPNGENHTHTHTQAVARTSTYYWNDAYETSG